MSTTASLLIARLNALLLAIGPGFAHLFAGPAVGGNTTAARYTTTLRSR